MPARFDIQGVAKDGTVHIHSAIVGIPETERLLDLFGDKAAKAMRGILYREGEAIMAESKRQVPVLTGTLRDSGHVQPPSESSGELSVVLGYGGPAAPYALYQHEEMTLHHKEGNAKFLAGPFYAAKPTMDDRFAAELRTELGV